MDNNNNYTTIMNESKLPKKTEVQKRDISIHTMPKRYKETTPASKNAKSAGFFILLFGFIFLLGLFFSIYMFVVKKDPVVVLENPPVEDQDQKPADTNDQAEPGQGEKDEAQDEQLGEEDDVNESASSTESGEIRKISAGNASSTAISPYDSDGDGLSDLEELLLGSSPNSKDSDGDGFEDAVEVANLYDPAGKGKLIDSLHMSKFVNEDYGYSFYVSSIWVVDKFAGFDTLFIELGKEQFFQIVSQRVDEGTDIEDWYRETFDIVSIPEEQIFTRGDWKVISNEQGYTAYMQHKDSDFFVTINYELGADNTLYYTNMYQVLINSMTIEETEIESE